MYTRLRFMPLILALLTVLLLINGTITSVNAAEEPLPWRAGLAKVVITPQETMWMAGYAARNKPAEGAVHDLYAKALVLKDSNSTTFILVTLDLISVPHPIRNYIESHVNEKYNLPASALMINCSHTHCGPEIRTTRWSFDGLPSDRLTIAKKYVEDLQSNILKAIDNAMSSLQPSNVSYCRARCGFAMNRRTPSPTGYRNSPNPNGPVDHDVPVLKIQDMEGHLTGVVFGYACHNTTLGFYQFCGDYAGFAQQYLEEDFDGAIAMFVLGCGADQNPYPRGTLDLAKTHGRTLATAVKSALGTTSIPISDQLKHAYSKATLAYSTPPTKEELVSRSNSSNKYIATHGKRLLQQLESDGMLRTTYDAPVQVVQLGENLTLIALPGETCVDYALRLKAELIKTPAQQGSVWVAGYSNDVFAYVPSRRVLLEGGYEAGGAMKYFTTVLQHGPFAPDVEERLIKKVHELLGN